MSPVQEFIYTFIIALALVFSVATLMVLSRAKTNDSQKYVTLAVSMIMLYLMGYLSYHTGTNENALLVGIKLQYVAGVGLYLVQISILAQVYELHIPRIVSVFLLVWSSFLIIMILLVDRLGKIGICRWVYTDYHVVIVRSGQHVLVLIENWGYHVLLASFGLYLLFMLGVFFYQLARVKKTERRFVAHVFALMFSPLMFIVLPLVFHLGEQGFPLVPLLLMGFEGTVISLTNRQFFCTLHDLAYELVTNSLHDPIFIVDTQFRLTAVNLPGKELFPSFSRFGAGLQSIPIPLELQHIITPPVLLDGQKKSDYVIIRNHSYVPELHRVERDGRLFGYVINLNDITTQHIDQIHLKDQMFTLQRELQFKDEKLFQMYEKSISGTIQFCLDKDISTGNHMRRTSNYTLLIARQLQKTTTFGAVLTDDFIETLCRVAPLHDVGKFLMPKELLQKHGTLTELEREQIKDHVAVGANWINRMMVNDINDLHYRLAYEVALFHHEWWNGKGYIKGLRGEEIPLSARILAVADVFDALTAYRPYKTALPFDEAVQTIVDLSGKKFDPRIVGSFIAVRPELQYMLEQSLSSAQKS
ncbi:MAG: HD domain-containing protein [Treponema sp.]|nr:HD domain-containing protein [Treponema sp.]